MYQLLADAVVFLHFLFVLFALAGGFLGLRWPRAAWAHLPMAGWAALVELAGLECPLTPLENRFRVLAGGRPYEGDFLTRYLLRLLYPEHLTAGTQRVLAGIVVAVNLAVYAFVLRRRAARGKPGTP